MILLTHETTSTKTAVGIGPAILFLLLTAPLYAFQTMSCQVVDSRDQKPLALVFLTLQGPNGSTKLNQPGDSRLTITDPGHYKLTAEAPGYHSATIEFDLPRSPQQPLRIELQPAAQLLEHMVVSPSHYSFIRETGETMHSMTREEIQNSPRFGDDLFRTLTTLPGASSGDYSAAFGVRGGEYRELVVTLDGMELHDPFHLKDFTGVFSIIDPETIGGLDLITGGYAARHGNALSGVMEMTSSQPTRTKTTAGLSFSNASFRTEGVFAEGLGSYLWSARRGYLDILLDLTGSGDEDGEEFSMGYWDSFAKVEYAFHPQHAVSLDFLLAGDDLKVRVDDDEETVRADTGYDNTYIWINWRAIWQANLSSNTIVYFSDFKNQRDAESQDDDTYFLVDDQRDYDHRGIKQDWFMDIDNRHYLTWGWDAKQVSSIYGYHSNVHHEVAVFGAIPSVPRDVWLQRSGDELSAYVSDRIRLGKALVVEAGLRYDRQSITDESQISPRLNLAYTTGSGNVWRAAWGQYHQASRIHELQVEDGVNDFASAEKATHALLGYEHAFGKTFTVRLEAFHKELEDLRPRFENMFQALEAFPELSNDRYLVDAETAQVRGMDLILNQNMGNKWAWAANYTYSKADDDIGGVQVPRNWDQRHAGNLSVNYQWTPRLHLNVSYRYHSGWRTTPVTAVIPSDEGSGYLLVPGPTNREVFPTYQRLDLRLIKRAKATKRGGFEWYLDVHNLLDRDNIKGYNYTVYEDIDGELRWSRDTDSYLPILPTFGMTWTF